MGYAALATSSAKIICMGVVLLLLVYSLLSYGAQFMFVHSKTAPIMEKPAINSNRIGTLKRGERVRVIRKEDMWLLVEHRGLAGWVFYMMLGSKPPHKPSLLMEGESISEGARLPPSRPAPAAATRYVSFDPLGWLIAVNGIEPGRNMAYVRVLLDMYPLLADEERTKQLISLGQKLSAYSKVEMPVGFGILDTEEINTFSTPEGFVFITEGCLKHISSEAELAGLLAHEIAHISEMHTIRKARKAAGPEAYLRTGYSLDEELEADTMATVMLALSGYPEDALLRFYRRLVDRGVVNWGPLATERFGVLERLLRTSGTMRK